MNDISHQPMPAPSRRFLFRGNAVAAGGFLTKMKNRVLSPDANTVTTHGESCLPLIGGVSHSVVQQPKLPFPSFIRHGRCETYAQGVTAGASATTILRASVEQVNVTTSPTSDDNLPGVQSISFHADRLSIDVRSIHPGNGQPSFEVTDVGASGLFLAFTRSGKVTNTPIQLEFDRDLMALRTMTDLDHKFQSDSHFFEEHAPIFSTGESLTFGKSKVPRTPEGYVFGSIVKSITFGDRRVRGNVLAQPGFGSISFGVFLIDEVSRRISMATIHFGSDPGGHSGYCSIETNGIWN